MPIKSPPKSNTSGSTTVRPTATPDVTTPRSDTTLRPGFDSLGLPSRPLTPAGDADLDAITPAPAVTVHPSTSPAEPHRPADLLLEHYRINGARGLPAANTEGLRVHKGRQYVDVVDVGIVQIAKDADTGLYRAHLASESKPSGPVLIRDGDSGFWRANDDDVVTAPLTGFSLQAFRTDLDFSTSEPDIDGLFRHDGKRYALIHDHAYQVMLDKDGSTPVQKVWRIVNAKDPVATDGDNIYHASRSGESRAVTLNANNTWVSVSTGLLGGMRRHEAIPILLQRYEPFVARMNEINQSAERYNVLAAQADALPSGSAERTAALIVVEVHLLRHIKKQADNLQSIVDHKSWLIHLKANGVFAEELHALRLDHVKYLNRLMNVMNFRGESVFTTLTADNCVKIISFMNKKLKLLKDREAVMELILKADRGAAPILAELRNEVATAERINFNKLTLYVHLLAGTPDYSPNVTMRSLYSIDLITGDLQNIPEGAQPLSLMLTLDQIRAERGRFEAELSAGSVKAEYAREILALTDQFETGIETRLKEIFASFNRNTELPSLDQNIDFDFIPPRPSDSVSARPPSMRKVFRTRRHGTSRVMVGDMETAADGSVIVKVSNPFQPDGPVERYEKRQGEWLPVRPHIVSTPRPELIAEANRLLVDVEKHVAQTRTRETAKDNPTEIIEELEKAIDPLNEQARRLQNHDTAAEDAEIQSLAERLQTAADTLTAQGQRVLVRMYKNKDVLDIMRLNWLIDHAELKALKTVDRKQLGKGKDKSFLDVYSIRDRANDAPLWEAHFHYEKQNSEPLNFTIKGSHLKTLEQSRRGIESQRRDEQAGLPHAAIWRQTFDGKTATKIFALASNAAVATR
ncbi:hypothetical protein JRG42_05675 [Pseudomonas granadensis]|uniref:hypothetical protein n=1 Tax=Pseudomonas granadensis TaxID=1421430 RepID=UPI0019D2A2D8|nr:hypothetical protein [Pseudomonas granadensis]MBN6772860.1 hypothetical protein [Pseudomonas granadensis]MBN6803954.1 hypothetical protein [Pseudomonas granadensis]MBN6830633.1 hypothetical protein [Pseudomonas granadensis]MBN6838175.1 hypothetical protein [Pseudomonas granadensis]MBN6867537.1 hypothetical protein [Pseudomonas granadensis]